MEGIDKGELIRIISLVMANDLQFTKKEFPSLVTWIETNATEEDINEMIEEGQSQVEETGLVHIDRNDFVTLYAHTQAVLGFEETRHRFPKLRLLVLNLMDEEELLSTMNLIRSIEERIKPGTDE